MRDLLVLLNNSLLPSFRFFVPALRVNIRFHGFVVVRNVYYFLLCRGSHQLGLSRVLAILLPVDSWTSFNVFDGLPKLAFKVSRVALGAQDCYLILMQIESRLAFGARVVAHGGLHG